MRILPKDTANPYLRDRTNVLILAETTTGEFTMSYFVRKPYDGIFAISDWVNTPAHRAELDQIKVFLTWGELSRVCVTIDKFLYPQEATAMDWYEAILRKEPPPSKPYDLERSWQSQKEHNQPDTPTPQDQIIASLVAQVNGLATNLSNLESFNNNLEGELNAHRQTECLQLDDINRRLNDHTNLDSKYDDSNQLRLEGIDKQINDLDSRIDRHADLGTKSLMSIAGRLDEIEVKLHEYLPGKGSYEQFLWRLNQMDNHIKSIENTSSKVSDTTAMKRLADNYAGVFTALLKMQGEVEALVRGFDIAADHILELEKDRKPVSRFRAHKSHR